MSYSPLVLALTSVTAVFIFHILNMFGRLGAKDRALKGLYSYSIGMRVFLWVGSVLFALLPLAFIYFGVKLVLWQWVVNGVMAFLMLFGCIYTDRYMVELTDTTLVYGAFSKKSILYREITMARMERSGRGSVFFVVRFAGKGRLALDGSIQGFDDLVSKLKDKLRSTNPAALTSTQA